MHNRMSSDVARVSLDSLLWIIPNTMQAMMHVHSLVCVHPMTENGEAESEFHTNERTNSVENMQRFFGRLTYDACLS